VPSFAQLSKINVVLGLSLYGNLYDLAHLWGSLADDIFPRRSGELGEATQHRGQSLGPVQRLQLVLLAETDSTRDKLKVSWV
jgi:hypothetical protein